MGRSGSAFRFEPELNQDELRFALNPAEPIISSNQVQVRFGHLLPERETRLGVWFSPAPNLELNFMFGRMQHKCRKIWY